MTKNKTFIKKINYVRNPLEDGLSFLFEWMVKTSVKTCSRFLSDLYHDAVFLSKQRMLTWETGGIYWTVYHSGTHITAEMNEDLHESLEYLTNGKGRLFHIQWIRAREEFLIEEIL